jgi:DNA-binding Lrp family transcriptional regulator
MLCVMWEGPVPGELRERGGEPMTEARLALLVGAPPPKVRAALAELDKEGVFSRDGAVIYSRRLRREAQRSEKRAAAGRRGAATTNRQRGRQTGRQTGRQVVATLPLGLPSCNSVDNEESNTGQEAALMETCEWWNGLKERGLVASGVRLDPISKSVRKGWDRCQREPELRDLLEKLDEVESMIERSRFCRGGWFRLPVFLGGKNKHGEWIAVKLLEGGYTEGGERFDGLRQFVEEGNG